MTRLRYRIVDVFSERPLAGNALCVVLDDCPPELMQPVAREVNLSETTFPTLTRGDAYDVRIFTPTGELPFAGHPTIGTAWALGPGRWEQTSPGVTVSVVADAAGAELLQPDPTLREVDADGVAAALGLNGVEGAWCGDSGGTIHVLAPTTDPLDAIQPDLGAVAAIARRAGAISLCPFRRVDDRTIHVRVFLPAQGVPEDPGTGSAAGPIGLLARQLFGCEPDITIRQGDEIGRACRIRVHAEGGDVRVGGAVAACAEGLLTV